MAIKKIISTLHPLERAILPLLKTTSSFSELVQKSQLKEVEAMRALEWLENKKIIAIQKKKQQLVQLGKNGLLYLKEGLPEKRFLKAVEKSPQSLDNIQKIARLSKEEINISLGLLKRLQAIEIKKDMKITIKITKSGLELTKKETPEEKFLQKKFPLSISQLKEDSLFAFQQLKKRKDITTIKDQIERIISPTQLGRQILKQGIGKKELIGRLTPNILSTGLWHGKEFRHYDIQINVPSTHPGKRHIVSQAVRYIKRIWLELGFREMQGSIIQTAFWDLDALFVPQDHPARDMQDTFYLADPEFSALPPVSKKVKDVHETGKGTKSKGWQYKWDKKEAEKLLLRTHTTVLSAQTISQLKKADLPAKFFSVGKVFRNETLDYSHLFEFYQVEGIVVDPNANFKHLKGYLNEFYQKMGYPKVRIRPAHFPYTEPSCEVEVFHPVKKEWLELGGAGIFRPEVVVPLLGQDIPVLAWGLGLDRIISSYYQISDIRDLYKNDIQQLRQAKLWVK